MRSIALFTFCLFVSYSTVAQRITFSQNSLDFGTVNEKVLPQQFLQLGNGSASALQIDSIKTIDVKGAAGCNLGKAFLATQAGPWIIAPGGSTGVPITFTPRHNVTYASPVLVCGSGIPGCRSLSITGTVAYTKTYYSSTQNLFGQALFSALKTRLGQNYAAGSYNAARDQMFMTIDNQKTNGQGAATNTLECVYSGRQTTGFTSRSGAQADNFNTEHTIPQSLFSSALPMMSDIHHLFPTDATPNSTRANYPFDTVSSTPSYSLGGSKLGTNARRIVFEPRAKQKGPTARAMCYFVVRYQDYDNFFAGQESILRKWVVNYPADTIDRKRNDGVQAFQGNRNPFVDYPQLLERLPSLSNPALSFPVVNKIKIYPATAALAASDTNGYFFSLVNEGTTTQALTTPAIPSGFILQPSAFPAQLEYGQAFTFRLLPGTASPGTSIIPLLPGTNISVTITGPLALSEGNSFGFELYPNPATQLVTIKTVGKVKVYDTRGVCVYSGTGGQLDISSWVRGVYRVVGAGKNQTLAIY